MHVFNDKMKETKRDLKFEHATWNVSSSLSFIEQMSLIIPYVHLPLYLNDKIPPKSHSSYIVDSKLFTYY